MDAEALGLDAALRCYHIRDACSERKKSQIAFMAFKRKWCCRTCAASAPLSVSNNNKAHIVN